MTHILRADEGKWITEIGFIPTQEIVPNFWKEIRTSTPEMFEEVTDEVKEERIDEWNEAHKPKPEPETEE